MQFVSGPLARMMCSKVPLSKFLEPRPYVSLKPCQAQVSEPCQAPNFLEPWQGAFSGPKFSGALSGPRAWSGPGALSGPVFSGAFSGPGALSCGALEPSSGALSGPSFWSLVRPKFLEPCRPNFLQPCQAPRSLVRPAKVSGALSSPMFLEPCFWSLVRPHVF